MKKSDQKQIGIFRPQVRKCHPMLVGSKSETEKSDEVERIKDGLTEARAETAHSNVKYGDIDASTPPSIPRGLGQALRKAGIKINGARPWDIQLRSPRVLDRVLAKGTLALGEAYVDGEWEVASLDEFFRRVLQARIDRHLKPLELTFYALRARCYNLQSKSRAWQVGKRHYDLGNDFYAAMLDPLMTYTCGYWKDASNLADAQRAKLELICQKLHLEPGMRVLDIGCGWGSFMRYAAENYGVECVGVTISKEQAELGRLTCKGLPIQLCLQDYRDTEGSFDRIVSVGMFEHVGRKNYSAFMKVVKRCLADDGLVLLHTIGKNASTGVSDPWIHKYIFPNGDLPSLNQITASVEGRFIVEDIHNFGADYDKTLMAWCANFETAWPCFADQLGERFYRMWRYYLLSCAGAFRARELQLWQFVLSHRGVLGGYLRKT